MNASQSSTVSQAAQLQTERNRRRIAGHIAAYFYRLQQFAPQFLEDMGWLRRDPNSDRSCPNTETVLKRIQSDADLKQVEEDLFNRCQKAGCSVVPKDTASRCLRVVQLVAGGQITARQLQLTTDQQEMLDTVLAQPENLWLNAIRAFLVPDVEDLTAALARYSQPGALPPRESETISPVMNVDGQGNGFTNHTTVYFKALTGYEEMTPETISKALQDAKEQGRQAESLPASVRQVITTCETLTGVEWNPENPKPLLSALGHLHLPIAQYDEANQTQPAQPGGNGQQVQTAPTNEAVATQPKNPVWKRWWAITAYIVAAIILIWLAMGAPTAGKIEV